MSRLYITAKSTPHHLEKKWMFQGKKKNWAELRAVIILINNLQFPSPSDKQEPAFPSAPLPLASAPSQLWEKRWQKHKSRAMLSHAFSLELLHCSQHYNAISSPRYSLSLEIKGRFCGCLIWPTLMQTSKLQERRSHQSRPVGLTATR